MAKTSTIKGSRQHDKPGSKRGRIALITTPEFREKSDHVIQTFVDHHLLWLCTHFDVVATGGTYDHIRGIVDRHHLKPAHKLLIDRAFKSLLPSIRGMIQVAFRLVQGSLDAVVHLTDPWDVAAKPDSAALRRLANVHDVPIASDVYTAEALMRAWAQQIKRKSPGERIFRARVSPVNPLRGLRKQHNVLALIAHNQMKLEMCRFVVKHAKHIFRRFDFILATGDTGEWARKFAEASGRSAGEIDKVRCGLSGPEGGDVQIARAVIDGVCGQVIFFQDPLTSHPHEVDIRLFEQSVILVKAVLATNAASAENILGVGGSHHGP